MRKPCIPCLMQPRFRPYGWVKSEQTVPSNLLDAFFSSVGNYQRSEDSRRFRHFAVRKGDSSSSKFVVRFSFEEAFAVLIREIEMVRRDPSENHSPAPPHQRPPSDGPIAVEPNNAVASKNSSFWSREKKKIRSSEYKTPAKVVPSENELSPIANWNIPRMRQWLESIGLGQWVHPR